MTVTISAPEAHRLLASGAALLIDVREPDEFRASHIPHAASMPLGALPTLLADADLPADRLLIFQCQKGARGGRACALAEALVGDRVRNLDGGIDAWSAAGLPLVGLGAPRMSIFRQVQMIVGVLVFAGTLAGLMGFAPGFYAAGFFGFMLAFAGASGWCGLGLALQRMPWNRMA
ncbi:rhodanese-like domain-containing protein [Sphingomonas sp. R1]|uniref:rhodanese-like domain-containing protein n=1 Tax=Sphingomonas sp. R1 TaxID=399176 RepID=UPI002223FB9A|nr:rhodanese-like domain-containing protein [Sphingomonas sp. R1]UYY75846.1 rhodanese-like domain-containing protein [Sphingomonas sp. R1]